MKLGSSLNWLLPKLIKMKEYLKPKNYFYFFQGKYRKFIIKQYQKIDGDQLFDKALHKAASCPECYFNGACLICECGFDDMILSDKPCPKGKF
jgi:hypothetical protein